MIVARLLSKIYKHDGVSNEKFIKTIDLKSSVIIACLSACYKNKVSKKRFFLAFIWFWL